MTITEFLTARYDEDEVKALAAVDREVETMHRGGWIDWTRDDTLNMPESDVWRRPVADVAAKRAIVAMATAIDEQSPDRGRREVADATLRLLAQPYADHPNYDESWKP